MTAQSSPVNGPISVLGSTTIPNMKVGAPILCKSIRGLRVTAPATRAAVVVHSRGKTLRLRRLANGSIRVSCPSAP